MKNGALREYIKGKYGKGGFDKDGNLRESVLRQALKRADEKHKKMIVFALNIRGKKRR